MIDESEMPDGRLDITERLAKMKLSFQGEMAAVDSYTLKITDEIVHEGYTVDSIGVSVVAGVGIKAAVRASKVATVDRFLQEVQHQVYNQRLQMQVAEKMGLKMETPALVSDNMGEGRYLDRSLGSDIVKKQIGDVSVLSVTPVADRTSEMVGRVLQSAEGGVVQSSSRNSSGQGSSRFSGGRGWARKTRWDESPGEVRGAALAARTRRTAVPERVAPAWGGEISVKCGSILTLIRRVLILTGLGWGESMLIAIETIWIGGGDIIGLLTGWWLLERREDKAVFNTGALKDDYVSECVAFRMMKFFDIRVVAEDDSMICRAVNEVGFTGGDNSGKTRTLPRADIECSPCWVGTPSPYKSGVLCVFADTCHKVGVRLNREEIFDVEEDNDHVDEYFRRFDLYDDVYNKRVDVRSLDELQVIDGVRREDRLTGSDEKDGNRIQGDVEIQGENGLTVSVGSLAAPTESAGYENTTTERLGFGERREAPLESKRSDMLDGKVVRGIATLTSFQKGSVEVDVQYERVREMGDDKCGSAVDPSVP
eukprot:gene12514-26366_t